MRLTAIELCDFRSYQCARLRFGDGLHVIHGPNGAGKSNLLEAIYLACAGRSCRTAHDRELIAFDACAASVRLQAQADDGGHTIVVVLSRDRGKQISFDGSVIDSPLGRLRRPLTSVFLPDRLALIKGSPALRRAHLDQLVAALWPARGDTRRAYAQALAQRNALLGRIRTGRTAPEAVRAWDHQLAALGVALIADRRAALQRVCDEYRRTAAALGLSGRLELCYRSRACADSAEQLADELANHLEVDLQRGHTTHGPHRDELSFERDGRELRTYASQGEQRLALLALLLAEREVIAQQRGAAPVMLLDDVMSELDRARRETLVQAIGRAGGQAFIATTDPNQVPSVELPQTTRIEVRSGRVLGEALAA